MDIAIELKSVTKRYRDLIAVNSIDMEIRRGEYVALLGPNGAGKTTLVEMIEGIIHPDSGSITINGMGWHRDETAIRRMLGITLQETQFTDLMTVYETINMFGSFYGVTRKRSDEILNQVGLSEKRDSYIKNLSGGQKQKLAIATALVNEPQILILDEPTTGLDPNSRREVWSIISSLKEKNTTMILTTHYMEEAQFLCSRIYIMNKGSFLAQGTMDELLARYGEGEIVEFGQRDDSPAIDISRLTDVIRYEWKEDDRFGRIVTTNPIAVLNYILGSGNIAVKEIHSRKMTLDDLFVSLTGRHLDE